MTCSTRPKAGRGRRALVALGAALCLAAASPARAQMVTTGATSDRPYRGLFGGAGPATTSSQSLILNGAVFAGYDDDIFARGAGPAGGGPNRPRLSGNFLGSQVSLGYQRRFATATVSASAATANRYLANTSEFVQTFAAASIGVQGSASRRTQYQLRQGVGYRPFFTPALFPATSTVGPSLGEDSGAPVVDVGDIDAPDDFTVASDRRGIRYSTLGLLQRGLTPRSSVQLRGQYSLSDFRSEELATVDNSRAQAGGTYSYQMSRYLSARLGYLYRSFNSRAAGTAGNHDVNVGVGFNRPFRLGSGATVFSFTTGSTILRRERLSGQTGDGNRLVIRAIGTATLSRIFSPSWQGNVSYAHSVGYVDGFPEPVEGDRVVATLGGLLTPRLDVSASAGYLSGSIGLRERNFDTTIAGARLRWALNARTALFAQYFYYQYSYANGVADQVLAAPGLRRQGLRGGVSLWLPVLR